MTSITRSVTVRLDPAAAFEVFTAELDTWYPRGRHSFNYPDRAVGVELEPGVGGRWWERWHYGGGYEIGQVLAWEPGRRLVLSYRSRYLPDEPLTEIEVRFEPVAGGTLVTLEHRGWERLPPQTLREWAGRAWKGMIAAYEQYVRTGGGSTMSAVTQHAESTAEVALDRQPVTPMLDYADGPAAMDWLVEAFGFVERTRWLDHEGRLSHGELVAYGGLIMLATPSPAYEGPKQHREHCARAAAWHDHPYVVDGVLVHVDDVDAHHARAAQAGARVLSEPEDSPYGRLYRVEDLEGHRWMFLQPTG